MNCTNLISMGQGGNMTCGDKYGETVVLCYSCKTKNKLREAFIDGCVVCGMTEENAEITANLHGYKAVK